MTSAKLKSCVKTLVLASLSEDGPYKIGYFIAPGVSFCEKMTCAAAQSGGPVFGNVIAGQNDHLRAGICLFDYFGEFQTVPAR